MGGFYFYCNIIVNRKNIFLKFHKVLSVKERYNMLFSLSEENECLTKVRHFHFTRAHKVVLHVLSYLKTEQDFHLFLVCIKIVDLSGSDLHISLQKSIKDIIINNLIV